jgi:DNA-binding beta-propeller fold protein YncE
VDPASDNVYVADDFNDTIRSITPAGIVTTLPGSTGLLVSAGGVAVDPLSGNIYVVNPYSSTISAITPAGLVTTVAGAAVQPGSADGTGSAARFFDPGGLAVDTSSGKIYVADTSNDTIRMLSIPTVAAPGAGAGTSPVAVSVALSGLHPGTTYYVRAVATSAGGRTAGAVFSFTTPLLTPAPTPTPTPTSTPTPTPTPSPVTVLGVDWQTRKLSHRRTEKVLVVTFSGSLETASAESLASYHLLSRGRGKAFTKPNRLASAVYDTAAHTVVLTPRGDKVPSGPLELEINTSSIIDMTGQAVRGNMGANYTASLSRS